MSSVAKKKASSSKAKKKESCSESKKKAPSSSESKKAPSSSKATKATKADAYSKAKSKARSGPKAEAENAIMDCAADVEDDQAEILIQNPYYRLRSAYDMSYIPKDYCCTLYSLPDSMDKNSFNDLCRFSKLAIQQYNRANNTKYEFVQVLGRLMALVAGLVWYITFEAKQAPNDSPATFQTLVFDGIPELGRSDENLTIEFVRMISSPSKEGDSCCSGN